MCDKLNTKCFIQIAHEWTRPTRNRGRYKECIERYVVPISPTAFLHGINECIGKVLCHFAAEMVLSVNPAAGMVDQLKWEDALIYNTG